MKTRKRAVGHLAGWGWLAAVLILMPKAVWAKGADASGAPSTVMHLSVEEAVMRGLEKDEMFLTQKLQPVVDGAFEDLERGEYDPVFFAEGSHGRQNTSEVARSTGNQFDVAVNQSDGVVGLEQRTPLGTRIETTVSASRDDSSRTPVQYGSRLGLGITQQLLRGMSPAVNLARIHRAELETRIGRHELAGYAQWLVAEVEIAYWQFVSATLSIGVVEKSLEVAKARLADSVERIAAGALAENEAAAASAEVGMREQKLIEARRFQNQQKLVLLQFVAPEVVAPLGVQVLTDTALEPMDEVNSSPKDSVALALGHRQEIAEAQLRQQQGELEVAVTKNGVLPRLELFIDLGKTGYASSFLDSFGQLGGSTYDVTAGVRFRHTLGNRSAKAQKVVASASLAMQKLAISNLRKVVTFDVHRAYNDLDSAAQLRTACAQTRVFSEAALQSIVIRFEAGAATRLEVVQAERDLLQSELDEVNAAVQYRIAKVRLQQAEGTLLSRRGIAVEE